MLLAGILVLAALLRLPLLDRVPNGFFLDEAARGYDAYALVRTGADQYGVRWPLFAEGLDDYTPALYTYLVVPFVALLGPTEVAVRLPAALVGIATVGLTHLLAASHFGRGVGLATAALLAVSPWHVLPSRTGAEWVLLPFFAVLGVWLLRCGLTRPACLAGAGIAIGVGLYSYAFARLLLPLLLLGFAILWWREIRVRWRWSLAGLLTIVVLALPLVQFTGTEAGRARLRAVVPFERLGPAELAPYALANYASYFSPEFLIWGSERSHHHRLAGFGPVLPFMAPLILVGIAGALARPDRARLFWLWWLVTAPAASALHRESPSSALLLGAIPSWHLFAALGGARIVAGAASWQPGAGRAALAAIVGLAGLTTGLAARALYVEYPVYAAADWEYGAGQVVRFVEGRRAAYDSVLVSDRLDTPHVLVLFFAPIDPASYQRSPLHVRQPNVRSRGEIGTYQFGRIGELIERPGRHLVWIAGEERAQLADRTVLLAIDYPDGRPGDAVFELTVPPGRR